MIGASVPIKNTTVPRQYIVCRVRHGNRNRDWDNTENYEYLLFKSTYSNIPITLQDVKEAYECCSGIRNDHLKCTCYQQFGVDAKMAEKYFKKMERMENAYNGKIELTEKEKNSKAIEKEKERRKKEMEKEKEKRDKGPFRKWFVFGKDDEDDDYDDDDDEE